MGDDTAQRLQALEIIVWALVAAQTRGLFIDPIIDAYEQWQVNGNMQSAFDRLISKARAFGYPG